MTKENARTGIDKSKTVTFDISDTRPDVAKLDDEIPLEDLIENLQKRHGKSSCEEKWKLGEQLYEWNNILTDC